MTQAEMFHDDIYSALRSAVEMLGGAKAVGHTLWPSKSVTDAASRLLNCLNPDHEQKLAPCELVQIAKMARSRGIHTIAQFFGQTLDYEIKPITAEMKQASLLEKWQKARSEVLALAEQMQRLAP